MRKKVYGQSQMASCPFCGEDARSKNEQGVPVCRHHVRTQLPDLKCVCGSWLDIKESKYGVFYLCMNCGPVSQRKMLETNQEKILEAKSAPPRPPEREVRKEKGEMPLDRIRRKIREGEPLTVEELELL